MTDKIVNTTIEILGKFYPVRCPESEMQALQEAAAYLNQKMIEVQDSGKVINLERIAIITALNITYQFLQQGQQKNSFIEKINQHITILYDKLESTMGKKPQAEFCYFEE